MMIKWIVSGVVCIGIGIFAGAEIALAAPPCPPVVPSCPLGNYGKAGGQVWVCCNDTSHIKCVNWFKQKWICNYADPGDPITYGYTLSSTSDGVNLNCDHLNPGSCY